MQNYQIRDLEIISGIKAHTIRIWEQRFKIFIPQRTETNIRIYSDDDLRKLLTVVLLLNNGYKVSKIAGLDYSELTQIVREIEIYNFNEESLILAMINFDGHYFNHLIDKSVLANGFENTCKNLIYPLFVRIGMLWLTGAIKPSHEHFVSNIIRQKFFAQIDALPQPKLSKKRILLFLPEKEMHESGLLFSYYLARKKEHETLYLGQAVPVSDVVMAGSVFMPDIILCFFVANIEKNLIDDVVNDLLEGFPNAKVLISGIQVMQNIDYNSERVEILRTVEDFERYL